MNKSKFTQSALSAAVALVFGASMASAGGPDPGKCNASLEKISGKFGAAVGKDISKCVSTIAGKGNTAKSQAACQKDLAKIGTTLAKTVAKCDAAAAKSCDNAGLAGNGQLVSGKNAPGASAGAFACASALQVAEQAAIETELGASPQALSSIATSAGSKFCGDASTIKGAKGTACTLDAQCGGAGTCTATAPADITDLAAFVAGQPACVTHACSITAATPFGPGALGISGNTELRSASFLPLVGSDKIELKAQGALNIDVCKPATGLEVDGTKNRILTAHASKGISPIAVLVAAATVCVEQVNAEGWCDCGGGGSNTNVALCRASTSSAVTCGAGDLTLAAASTSNGPLVATYSTASTAGACAGALGIQFSAYSGVAGGVDGINCSGDEGATLLPPLLAPFTTGTATAQITDPTYNPNPAGVTGTQASSCANLDASVMTPYKFVAAYPLNNFDGSALGIPGSLNAILSISLACN